MFLNFFFFKIAGLEGLDLDWIADLPDLPDERSNGAEIDRPLHQRDQNLTVSRMALR